MCVSGEGVPAFPSLYPPSALLRLRRDPAWAGGREEGPWNDKTSMLVGADSSRQEPDPHASHRANFPPGQLCPPSTCWHICKGPGMVSSTLDPGGPCLAGAPSCFCYMYRGARGKVARQSPPQVVLALPRHCSSLGLGFSISARRRTGLAQES